MKSHMLKLSNTITDKDSAYYTSMCVDFPLKQRYYINILKCDGHVCIIIFFYKIVNLFNFITIKVTIFFNVF